MEYKVKNIFALNLKKVRIRLGLTQEKFAEKLGLQAKTIANFESGRHLANSENLDKICNGIDISPRELFLYTNENQTLDDKDKISRVAEMLQSLDSARINDVYAITSFFYDQTHFVD